MRHRKHRNRRLPGPLGTLRFPERRFRGVRFVRRVLLPMLLAALLVFAVQGVLWACPTCKDGLSQSDPAGQNVARGYFWSILFMMSMPFFVFSALGGYFYWEIRKARAGRGPSDNPALAR